LPWSFPPLTKWRFPAPLLVTSSSRLAETQARGKARTPPSSHVHTIAVSAAGFGLRGKAHVPLGRPTHRTGTCAILRAAGSLPDLAVQPSRHPGRAYARREGPQLAAICRAPPSAAIEPKAETVCACSHGTHASRRETRCPETPCPETRFPETSTRCCRRSALAPATVGGRGVLMTELREGIRRGA